MNEVTKLYENAGVDKINAQYANNISYHLVCYPPFTAEKQLELIKWLAETRPIHINLVIDKWIIEGIVRYGIKYDIFEDALSGYINQIWQDLTDAEKAKIRNILE